MPGFVSTCDVTVSRHTGAIPTPQGYIPGWSQHRGINRKYHLFIAAHGRSGTRYMSKLLGTLALDIGHEMFGKDGLVSWIHVGKGEVNNTLCAGIGTKYDVVLHQVRHPLRVISGSCLTQPAYADFAWKNMNAKEGLTLYAPGTDSRNPSVIEFWTRSWVKWNRKISEDFNPVYRYQVEQIAQSWAGIAEAIGSISTKLPEGIRDVPLDDHSWVSAYGEPLTWGELDAASSYWTDEARSLAEEYGYGNA